MADIKIPRGWQFSKLGDVCEVITGTTPPKSNPQNYGEDVPFFKPPHLWDTSISSTEEKLSFEGAKKARIAPENTVLVTCIGNLGRTGILRQPAAFNQQINAILENNNIIGKYIFYQAQSPNFKKQLEQSATGTTVSIVNKSNFERILIPYPNVEAQQAIVSKIEELFSELDKGIEDLKLAQQQLKVYRQSVLKHAFEGRLTNENVKDGELLEGWERVKLGSIAKKNKLKATPKDLPDAKFIGMDCIEPHTLRPKFTYNFKDFKSSGNRFLKDHVLYGRMRPYLNKVYRAEYSGVCSGEFIVLMCSENYYSDFLKYILHSDDFVNFANNQTTGDRPRISYDEISEYLVPLPPLEQQQLITEEIDNHLSISDNLEESITESLQKAEILRQSILKKAFRGELIAELKPVEVPKTKNEYFHQLQLVSLVINGSKKKKIDHGEMTLAKNLYLLDSIYNIPTGFKYDRWHLGPYPPALKKVVNNKEYFTRKDNHIEVQNEEKLLKYNNPLQEQITGAIDDLSSIFSKYKGAERSHKTELLATVCKVIEDIKTTDLAGVRESMQEWKIDLKNSKFRNKAEKFSEVETQKCIEFIVERGWDRKLI